MRLRRLLFFSSILYLCLSAPLQSALAADPVQIVVEGVEGEMRENVEAALALPQGFVRDGKVDRRWLERFRRQVPERSRRALEPFGYYRPEIFVAAEEVGPGNLQLRVEIRPGPPVRVAQVRVEIRGPGSDRVDLRELAGQFPLRSGEVLRHDLYEEGKGALKARALDLGFLEADFTEHEIRVNREEGRADIDLVLDTGPRFHFGEIAIEGAEDYPRAFLRRHLAFAPGDVFSFAKLGETQLNFLDSDRFREVIVTPREEEAEETRVPVTIQLTPLLPKRLRPGVGYATDTGPRLSLQYRDVNFSHRGRELEAELLVAQLKQSLGLGYVIPSGKNIHSQTAFRVGYDQEDIDVFERSTIFAEVERSRAFSRSRRGAVFLRLLQEDFTIGEESSTARLVLPGARYSQRKYDSVRPEKGYSFTLEGRGTHQVLGSDTGLVQFLASGNTLIPLPARLSLFLRVQAGATIQNEPLAEIPPSIRFFAGGDQSVRGYGFQTLGPTDSEGNVVGGKNLLVGSAELERAFFQDWGVAVFYDVGNAFNAFSDIPLRGGAGLGLRWYTPVGPVRFDIARQVGVSDPSLRLHISVGFGW